MTELEFINVDPRNYGAGPNVNLLYSSSVADPGVDNTPTAPFVIQGISVPFAGSDGINISAALKEVDKLRFNFTEGVVTLNITARQKKNGWFFFRTDPAVFNTLPTLVEVVQGGTPYEQNIYRYDNTGFVFLPYVQLSFINNDYNVLFNNATVSKTNAIAQKVDRTSDAANPTNLTAIINQTATPAEIQNCTYTKAGIVNGRYEGTKLTSGSLPKNDPALSLKEFEGSLYSPGSSDTTIKAINLSDREIINIYFNANISSSGATRTVQTFPDNTNLLFQEQGNRFIRVVNRKVFAVELNKIFTTNEFGEVSSIS